MYRILALLVLTTALHAQEESFWSRFSLGARFSIVGNDLMNDANLPSSTSDPPVQTTLTSTSNSSVLGGGALVEVEVSRRLAVAGEVVYRRVGYRAGVDIVEGLDDEDTDEDDRIYTSSFEGTNANYWDIPVLLRFYDVGRTERTSRGYFEGGATYRRVSQIRTFREFIDTDGVSTVDGTATVPANSSLLGITLGAGFELRSKVGIKVAPGVRYTRWLGHTFDAGPTRSKKNQVEFVLGISF